MTVKAKINPDAAPPSAVATWTTAEWRQNLQNPREAVPVKLSWGGTPSTTKFDDIYNNLKGRGIVFDSANPQSDQVTHVRHKNSEYVGKEYKDGEDIRWKLKHEKIKTSPPPSSMREDAIDVDKEVFKVDVSEYVKFCNRQQANL